jgi:protein-tyrosine phosphatase
LDDVRLQVEATAVEEDVGYEPLPIPVAVGFLDEALTDGSSLFFHCHAGHAPRSRQLRDLLVQKGVV